MRRVASILLVLVIAVGFAVLSTGAGEDPSGTEHTVELDNAFGLIEGADLKIAGVRAGKITSMELDRRTHRAIVGFRITKTGFGSLRTDARCETRPQSLIGEYFIDCSPGTAATRLPRGSRIPVTRTSSTVGPDLVNNILRRPFRERLALIVNELGAAAAGNAENLDAAIRRAVPGLRETDKVLALLARQNTTLAELTENADTVLADLAGNRKDVGRWVKEARDTAVASAERRDDIALGFRRLPAFLEELRPTMVALGATADAQTPTLRNLSASAAQLERLFGNIGPFSEANRPALRALARASKTGRQAVRAATPVVAQLGRFARGTPELAGNLATILKHIDDPAHAVEDDPRAARATGRAAPTGYTGLEALLSYTYDQTMSTNIFDANEHILKIGLIPPSSACARYADEKGYVAHKEECDTHLGPNQPGLNFTDPTARPGDDAATIRRRADVKRSSGPADSRPEASAPAAPAAPAVPSAPAAPARPAAPVTDLPSLLDRLPKLPPVDVPGLDALGDRIAGRLGGTGAGQDQRAAGESLLSFLLGP